MASILILSKSGAGLPLTRRLALEGNIVKVWCQEDKTRDALKGSKNPSFIGDPRKMLEQYDLILPDESGMGKSIEYAKTQGKLCFGGTFSDKLELDPEYAKKVYSTLVKLPEEELEEGISISLQGWFNGETFINLFVYTVNKDRFMEGDKGSNSCHMGCISWLSQEDKLISTTLMELIPLLLKVNYLGPLTINFIIQESRVKFKGFVSRFTYDQMESLTELIKGTLFDFIYSVATTKGMDPKAYLEYSMSVRLSVPPYPYEFELPRTSEELFIDPRAERHIWLSKVNNVLGCVTARGESVRECKRRVYRTIQNLELRQDVQYRRDIGDDVEEKKALLSQWGWLNA